MYNAFYFFMQAKQENVDVPVASIPKSDAPASKTGEKRAVCLLYYVWERITTDLNLVCIHQLVMFTSLT